MPGVEAVAVEVPATSANLGPGFDAFAAALDLHLTAWILPRGELRVAAEGEGADELPGDETNLVWRGLVAYCERFGAPVPDVSLGVRSAIPLERGLGSSAAAAVAGVALGRAVTRAGGQDSELIAVAAELEGHPDNAAAAVLGGVCVATGGAAWRLQPAPALRPVVCVPAERASTREARALLPASLPLADAAANGARAALVLAGLTGAVGWDPSVMCDVVHEPARFAVMASSAALVAALRGEGFGACLSGAGPAVLAVVEVDDETASERVRAVAGDGWRVDARQWDLSGAAVRLPTLSAREGNNPGR